MKKLQLINKNTHLAFLFVSFLFFSACDGNRIFEENQAIPNNVWEVDNVLKFDVAIQDTLMPTNFYINIRNSEGYPYSNLFLFVTTIFPNGNTTIDTLECVLADDKGKWLGSGMGDIYDNQIPFKKNVRFPISGTYTFEIQQGMRKDEIPLIMDAGMRIEKAN